MSLDLIYLCCVNVNLMRILKQEDICLLRQTGVANSVLYFLRQKTCRDTKKGIMTLLTCVLMGPIFYCVQEQSSSTGVKTRLLTNLICWAVESLFACYTLQSRKRDKQTKNEVQTNAMKLLRQFIYTIRQPSI